MNNEIAVKISFNAVLRSEDDLEAIQKAVDHHLEWLIDLDNYREIVEVFDGTVTILQEV